MAKFLASNDGSNNVEVKPNVTSYRSLKHTDAFDKIREMNTNTSKYGFNSNEVDVFLQKNTMWGAIAYLGRSNYGKVTEVWINPNTNYITGCAGTATSSAGTTACNQYHTTNGVNASISGTVYGVYDMSGNALEIVSAYLDNGNANLTNNGESIVNADLKYKDVYNVAGTETELNNYNANSNVFGDAVYETSQSVGLSPSNTASWFQDQSRFPNGNNPFFVRGGLTLLTQDAGSFAFHWNAGGGGGGVSFRPVIVIK